MARSPVPYCSPLSENRHGKTAARLRSFNRVASEATAPRDDALAHSEIPLRPLGSGSDYSPFIDYLGVAAIDLRFTGEASNEGSYHSSYDTFDHHSKFVDPGFVYDALLAKVTGRLVMRAADSDLPIGQPRGLADAVAGYLTDVTREAGEMRAHAALQNKLLQDNVFALAADPTLSRAPPMPLPAVPQLDFAPMDTAVKHLATAAGAYEAALSAKGAGLSDDRKHRLQDAMQSIDQTLVSEKGLPGRPWYRNLIYAPGALTGYDAKTLPGIREAMEGGRWDDARVYITLTAQALQKYADRLDMATRIME